MLPGLPQEEPLFEEAIELIENNEYYQSIENVSSFPLGCLLLIGVTSEIFIYQKTKLLYIPTIICRKLQNKHVELESFSFGLLHFF